MKKQFALFMMILFLQGSCSAEAVKTLTLKNNSIYLMLLEGSAKDFKISNPKVINIQVMTTLTNPGEQVVLKTLECGSTDLTIQTLDKSYSYKIQIKGTGVKDMDDDNIIEIEKPDTEEDSKND